MKKTAGAYIGRKGIYLDDKFVFALIHYGDGNNGAVKHAFCAGRRTVTALIENGMLFVIGLERNKDPKRKNAGEADKA